jgi:hypothetical protein
MVVFRERRRPGGICRRGRRRSQELPVPDLRCVILDWHFQLHPAFRGTIEAITCQFSMVILLFAN